MSRLLPKVNVRGSDPNGVLDRVPDLHKIIPRHKTRIIYPRRTVHNSKATITINLTTPSTDCRLTTTHLRLVFQCHLPLHPSILFQVLLKPPLANTVISCAPLLSQHQASAQPAAQYALRSPKPAPGRITDHRFRPNPFHGLHDVEGTVCDRRLAIAHRRGALGLYGTCVPTWRFAVFMEQELDRRNEGWRGGGV